jgi:hypothetical protein
MSETNTDYDLENSIRQIAARLQIAGWSPNSGKPLNELFSEIETRCPDAAEILLERTFEKDKLRAYLNNSPPFPTINGDIVGEGDAQFETHWNNLVSLYPMLLEAIKKCGG